MSNTHQCPACRERGHPEHLASAPRCAWTAEGEWYATNWQCASMNALRAHIEDQAARREPGYFWYRDDSQNSTIYVMPIPSTHRADLVGYVVITSYKNRGRTASAMLVHDEGGAPLTEAEADFLHNWLQTVA